jgi:hypothetical protein
MLVFILSACQQKTCRHDHRLKQSIEKTLVGDLWSAGNNFTDGFTDGQSTPKKTLPTSFCRYFHH